MSYDEEIRLGSSDRDIDSPSILRETQCVACSDTGQNNDVLFLALKAVDGIEIDSLINVRTISTGKDSLELLNLTLVHCDAADTAIKVLIDTACSFQAIVDGHGSLGFPGVEEGVSSLLFLTVFHREESEWLEESVLVPRLSGQLSHIGSIEELAAVECLAWMSGDLGVHTVLDTQQVYSILSLLIQSDKEGLRVLEALGLVADYRRWQLVRVTNEDASLCSVSQGDQGTQLDCLSGFVDDDRLKVNGQRCQRFLTCSCQCGTDYIGIEQNLAPDFPAIGIHLSRSRLTLVLLLIELLACRHSL